MATRTVHRTLISKNMLRAWSSTVLLSTALGMLSMNPDHAYAAQQQQQQQQQNISQNQFGQGDKQDQSQIQQGIQHQFQKRSQRQSQARQQIKPQRQSQGQSQKQQWQQQQGSQKKVKKSQGKRLASTKQSQAQFEETVVAETKEVRQFHEVLNDLLTELSYDVKQGQINGLKNVAIRRVSVSDALPKTYEQYVELLVTERIRENARIKIINCVSCKSKSSVLTDGKLMISSPQTNVNRMDEAAEQLGIENFMDVILVYHTTHMVLAFSVFNTGTKEEIWSRTYNSETLRSRYQKLAIDMNQIEKSRESDEYVPEYKLMLGIGGSQLPNVAGTSRDTSFLGLHIRSVEKFNNRKTDFGLLSTFWLNTSSFLKAYPSEGTASESADEEYTGEARPLPYKFVLGIHAIVARNFLGNVESYDTIRHGAHAAIGGILSPGYLAPSLRLGWDVYLGRRWVMTLSGQYIMQSTIMVENEFKKARGGVGGDLALSLNL